MIDLNTTGCPEVDAEHSPPMASKSAQNQDPTVTRNEEGKPTLSFDSGVVKVTQAPSDAPPKPARSSRLAALMKAQQHEPSRLGSLLDEIAQPTVTTYTPYGPSTRIGSVRTEIKQPTAAKYDPHPLTSQSPPNQQDRPSRNAALPDEINEPTAAAYSPYPPTSQFTPKQQQKRSTTGFVRDEISQPTVTTYTPQPPTFQSHPEQVDRASSELVISSARTIPQDEISVLQSTTGVIGQNASLVVPQPSQLPASELITPPLPLASSINSKIPLFHRSKYTRRFI